MSKFILNNSEIRIEPTNRCNAHCIMCPREKMSRKQGIMDFELYTKIIDQCVAAGAKKVSLENYGEPFIDPLIFKRAKYAKDSGLSVLTITNGSLLDEEKCKQVIELFDVIRISLYGLTKEIYEKIHRGLSFDSVIENVNRLVKLNSFKNTLRIQFYFLVLEENQHEVLQFIHEYKNKFEISVWKPHNWTDGRNYRTIGNHKVTCGRPANGPLQVQWDGKVVPCCFDYDSKMILGDFNIQSLEEIMRNNEYNKIREAHKNADFSKYLTCDICDQLNKREDILIFTNIESASIGKTNTDYFKLDKD